MNRLAEVCWQNTMHSPVRTRERLTTAAIWSVTSCILRPRVLNSMVSWCCIHTDSTFRPVRSVLHIHTDRHVQRQGVLHEFTNFSFHFLEFSLWHVKNQLVMHLHD